MFIIINQGLVSFVKKYAGFIFIIVSFFAVFFLFTNEMSMINNIYNRFSRVEDVAMGYQNVNSFLNYSSDTPSKLKTFIWALYSTNSLSDFFFGHGASYTDFTGNNYSHSSWAWIYGSMGIIGVLLIVILFFRIFKTYYNVHKKYKKDDLNDLIILLILYYFSAIILVGVFTGGIIQEGAWFINPLLLAILEIARRNTINNYTIYKTTI